MPRYAPGGTKAAPSSTQPSRPKDATGTTGEPGASAPDLAQLRKLIDQANTGNRQACDQLCARLPTDAARWTYLGDMAEHACEALIIAASGEKALFTQELIRRQCRAMAQDLAGPTPTSLETLLVDRIVLCWLHLHYVETIYAQNMKELSITQAAFHQHRITAAHNRYLSAIRSLAQVRRLQAPNVQVNIAEQQLNVAAIAPAHVDQARAQRTAR